jgi:hypothetical protein
MEKQGCLVLQMRGASSTEEEGLLDLAMRPCCKGSLACSMPSPVSMASAVLARRALEQVERGLDHDAISDERAVVRPLPLPELLDRSSRLLSHEWQGLRCDGVLQPVVGGSIRIQVESAAPWLGGA